MKKVLSILLVVLMIVSTFSLVVEAGTYTSGKATTKSPVCDGKISTGEYDGAMVVSFTGDSTTKYLAHNAARTLFETYMKSDIEARGSKMIGNSKIYTLPTAEGLYFAFDIADTTIGTNTVRDVQWSNGMFIGDAVHVTIRSDNNKCSETSFQDGDAIRFSVAPFKNDWGGWQKGYRTVDMLAAITNHPEGDGSGYDVINVTGMLNEACVPDESGYVVEFFVEWSFINGLGFTGPTSYKNGESIYFNFQITDAMGKNSSGTEDWGVFQILVNSGPTIEAGTQAAGGDTGTTYMVEGKANWNSYAAGTAEKMTFVVKNTETTPAKDTSKVTETKKVTETTKPNETKSNETKKTHTETKVVEHVETKENGETVIVTETETVVVDDETEVASETETNKATEKETEKETKKSDKKVSDNNFDPTVLIIIIIAVVVVAGVVVFIIVKKKKGNK